MVKLTFGQKTQRYKWNIYFLGILLTIGVVTCEVCGRVDWVRMSRGQWERAVLDIETKLLETHRPRDQQIHTLIAQCGTWLRERWMAGYLYDEKTAKEFFIGRVSADFRKAAEAQKETINAGKPFDTNKIPNYRFTVEFAQLKCRLVVGGVEPPNVGARDER